MINRIYKCSCMFNNHNEKLKVFLRKCKCVINVYQNSFGCCVCVTNDYAKNRKNKSNNHVIFFQKHKEKDKEKKDKERYEQRQHNENDIPFYKVKKVCVAHIFGLFAHVNKEKDENNRSTNTMDLEEMVQQNLIETEMENKTKVHMKNDDNTRNDTILTEKYIAGIGRNNDIRNVEHQKKKLSQTTFKCELTENIKDNTDKNKEQNKEQNREQNKEQNKEKNKDSKKYEYYQELSEYSNMQIFSSNSHHELANEICSNLGVSLGRAYIGKYSDGEIALQIMDEVRGRDIYIIHSTPAGGKDVHSRLMELFLFVSTLRRSSAKKVTAVIPYLNYSRQTRQIDDSNFIHSLGGPEVAILLQVCGVDAIILVDLHNSRIEGFSTINNAQPPLMNINPQSLAVEYFKKKTLHNPVIVSIDNEGGDRTKEFWIRMQKHGIKAGFTTVVSNTVTEMKIREGCPDSNFPEMMELKKEESKRNSEKKEIKVESKSKNKSKQNIISLANNIKNNINAYVDRHTSNADVSHINVGDDKNEERKKKEEHMKMQIETDSSSVKHNAINSTLSENFNNLRNENLTNKKTINHYDNENFTIVGDINGCDCILIDDIIDTGEKSQKVAALLKNAGARTIYLYATHAILSDGCVEKINESCIDEVVTTNTIHIPSNICCEKLHVLSVAKLVAEGIKRAHKQYSQTALEDFSDGEVEQMYEQ